MNSKEKVLIKICIVTLVILCVASVLYNIMQQEVTRSYYEPYKPFSVVVSEDKWDESMMPKGRRSPHGVLYNPEK